MNTIITVIMVGLVIAIIILTNRNRGLRKKFSQTEKKNSDYELKLEDYRCRLRKIKEILSSDLDDLYNLDQILEWNNDLEKMPDCHQNDAGFVSTYIKAIYKKVFYRNFEALELKTNHVELLVQLTSMNISWLDELPKNFDEKSLSIIKNTIHDVLSYTQLEHVKDIVTKWKPFDRLSTSGGVAEWFTDKAFELSRTEILKAKKFLGDELESDIMSTSRYLQRLNWILNDLQIINRGMLIEQQKVILKDEYRPEFYKMAKLMRDQADTGELMEIATKVIKLYEETYAPDGFSLKGH